MDKIHLFSIMLEVVVFSFAVSIGWIKKRPYGKGLALTFGIYVFYDLAQYYSWPVSRDIMYLLFLVASASALWAMLKLYRSA